MICPNIIIITSTDGGRDEESESAVQMLTARYSTRTLIHFKFTIDTKRTPEDLTKLIAEIDPKDTTERSRDTGVYALFHGAEGGIIFGDALTGEKVAPRGKADQFAKAILEFCKQGFHIRKICFVTCLGIQKDGKSPAGLPEKVLPGAKNLFVQHMCQRLTYIAQEGGCIDLLKGMMVAGYTTAVYLLDPSKATDPGKMKGRRPGAKTWQNIPKTDMGNPAFAMHPTVELDKSSNKPKDFKGYKERKCVFICDADGKWRLGGLWEYTDKAEWMEALGKPKLV